MAHHAWLIEAPGQRYLATREIGHHPHFFWTADHLAALRFYDATQADGVMMTLRRMDPQLFGFEHTLGGARPIEHSWMDPLRNTEGAPS